VIILNSKKFSNISYESGKEIYYHANEAGTPFSIDVTSDLTCNIDAMNLVASFLDDIDNLKEQALRLVDSAITNKENQHHSLVIYFFDEQKNPSVFPNGEETIHKMFGTVCLKDVSYNVMLKCLKIVRFGSYIDKDINEQAFIMDLCFDRDYTDELLVVYFDVNKNIFHITHES